MLLSEVKMYGGGVTQKTLYSPMPESPEENALVMQSGQWLHMLRSLLSQAFPHRCKTNKKKNHKPVLVAVASSVTQRLKTWDYILIGSSSPVKVFPTTHL